MGRRSRSRERRRSSSRSYSRSPSPVEFRIHIADLGIEPSKNEIANIFERFGKIRDFWLARNPPCFAFIKYKYREEAEEAIREMDGKIVSGERVRVSFARPRTRGNRRRGFDPNLRCYQCGEKGHFSRDCSEVWQNRRDRSRSHSRNHRREHRRRRSYSRSRSRSRDQDDHKRKRSKSSRSKSKSKSPKKDKKKSQELSRSKSRSKSCEKEDKTSRGISKSVEANTANDAEVNKSPEMMTANTKLTVCDTSEDGTDRFNKEDAEIRNGTSSALLSSSAGGDNSPGI